MSGASPSPARLNPAVILAAFVGALFLLALVAALIAFLNQPPAPQAPCEPGQPCAPQASLPPIAVATPAPTHPVTPLPTATPGTPVTPEPRATASPLPTPTPGSDSPAFVSGEVWRSATLGYSFEFDPELFALTQSRDTRAVLSPTRFDAQVIVVGAPGTTTPAQLIAQQLEVIDGFMIGRTLDADPYDALLGPSIGYVRGEGGVYSGTLLGADGTPVAPAGLTILASTDGRVTVAVVVLVGQPDVRLGADTHQKAARSLADEILKTFDWGSG